MARLSLLGMVLGLGLAAAIGVGLWLTSGSSEGTTSTGATLSRGWNNVSYQGDTLPVVQALNDALPVVESIWQWDAAAQDWASWTKGAPAVVNTLADLERDASFWVHTTGSGAWTFRGASTSTTGQDGLNCWDLNGNGQFDSAIEDQDSDGAASALDCQGPQGSAGARGPVGPTGPAGTAATLPSGTVIGVEVVDSGLALPSSATVGDTDEETVSCAAGQVVIGGGGTAGGSGTIAAIEDSAPTGGTPPTQWRVKASVISTSGFFSLWSLTAYAVCADVVP